MVIVAISQFYFQLDYLTTFRQIFYFVHLYGSLFHSSIKEINSSTQWTQWQTYPKLQEPRNSVEALYVCLAFSLSLSFPLSLFKFM